MLTKGRAFLVSLHKAQKLWSPGFLRRPEGFTGLPALLRKSLLVLLVLSCKPANKTSKPSLGGFGFETF